MAKKVLAERSRSAPMRRAALSSLLIENDIAPIGGLVDLPTVEEWVHAESETAAGAVDGSVFLDSRWHVVLYDLALAVGEEIFIRHPGTYWGLDTVKNSWTYHRHLVMGYPGCHRKFGIDIDAQLLRHFTSPPGAGRCSEFLIDLVKRDPAEEMASIMRGMGK